MSAYDIILLIVLLYTAIGSDLLLNWPAGLITGKRLRPDSPNFFERLYYRIHARNDALMRATPPIVGRPDRIPAWSQALAVTSGTLSIALEVVIVIGFVQLGKTGTVPKFALVAAFAWWMRGVIEILYWNALTRNDVEPLRGRPLAWYWLIGIPQAFIPFLVAERFYEGTDAYGFEPGRFLAFLAIPVALMVLTRLLYRGRVW